MVPVLVELQVDSFRERGIEDMEDMMAEWTALVVCNGTLQ